MDVGAAGTVHRGPRRPQTVSLSGGGRPLRVDCSVVASGRCASFEQNVGVRPTSARRGTTLRRRGGRHGTLLRHSRMQPLPCRLAAQRPTVSPDGRTPARPWKSRAIRITPARHGADARDRPGRGRLCVQDSDAAQRHGDRALGSCRRPRRPGRVLEVPC